MLPAACCLLPAPLPAFILGNGPTLPTAALPALANRFTIGVNRILRSGFVPTVIVWGDLTVYTDDGPAMDASGALLVCDRSVAQRAEHVGLQTFAGDDSRRRRATPWTLLCDGSTGCCAARWALSLGCRPVYLLGMSAGYDAGRTDSYGRNRWHDAGALDRMRRETERLLAEHGAHVHVIGDADALRQIAACTAAIDQGDLRQRLREMLTSPPDPTDPTDPTDWPPIGAGPTPTTWRNPCASSNRQSATRTAPPTSPPRGGGWRACGRRRPPATPMTACCGCE